MSSALTKGWSSLSSAGESAEVLTPIPRSISTLARRAAASAWPTTARKPVWVNTGGPPMISGQARKIGKLANARRASSSFV
jgi:hypothetical protein